MKSIVFVFIFTISLVYALPKFRFGRKVGGNLQPPPTWKPTRAYRDQWYVQKLDHFNESDTRTWRQRYLVDEQYFSRNSTPVVYLFMGGEGEISSYWMTDGNWLQTAKDSHALLFQLEHRYYGMSQPFDELSTENLMYLSSRQALADTTDFIKAMNSMYQLTPNVKWVAFGGSYSGSLVAWLRKLYPDVVHAAVASSAPILAKVDFEDYMRVVADDLRNYSQKCVDTVQQATTQLTDALDNLESANINELFNLCVPIEERVDSVEDIALLFEAIAYTFAVIAQYNDDSDIGSLKDVCSYFENESGTPLEVLANYIRDENICLSYDYQEEVEYYKTADPALAMRQWYYQTCTEFGFYQTSSYDPHVFGDKFPVEISIGLCKDVFDPQFDAAYLDKVVDETNALYGGLNINTTNVIFIHGTVDPWHALGLLDSDDPNIPVVYINGTSHCQDMRNPGVEGESADLLAAKTRVSRQVLEWLGL